MISDLFPSRPPAHLTAVHRHNAEFQCPVEPEVQTHHPAAGVALHRMPRRLMVSGLLCAALLLATGCQKSSGSAQHTEEELKAAQEQLAKLYPEPEPDTPAETQQKNATVEAKLPEVYQQLEEAKSDLQKADEVVKLSMSLLTLVPDHRAAKVAYLRARLAAFSLKEGRDHYGALVDINSAVLEADRLQESFNDLSQEERQVCQDVYFNLARREGYFPDAEDAAEVFTDAITKLMNSGFHDVERLRTEPKFQPFLRNPKTAPVLQAAIEQIN